ncbi:MAG: T9SS type A sorting domain-containing protein [Bacteroidales bacterium]|nr:T9SS type A sorting domain-containing protein [Bacteroidales bacterium]MDY0086781.1 T9SS type A sorting domain-containing protein [Bacteroidales bacterium]
MKTIYTLLLFVFIILFLQSQGQEVSNINYDIYPKLPHAVSSTVSPDGTVFRAELVNLNNSILTDTFVLNKLDENFQDEAEIHLSGYPLNLSLSADNSFIYVNIQLFDVINYPVILPSIGQIETGGFTNGTLIAAFSHDLELSWYDFIGTDSYSGRWKCATQLSQQGQLFVNVLVDHESNPVQSQIRAYNQSGELSFVWEQNVLVYSIKDDSDGNIYFTGSCAGNTLNFNGTSVNNTFNDNIFVAKYSSEGLLDWVNLVETYNCTFPDIVLSSNSEVYLTASLLGGNYTFGEISHQVNEYQQFVVSRINQAGNFELLRSVTMNDNELAITRLENNAYLAIDEQNNLYLSGLAFGPLSWNNGGQYNEFGPAGFVAKLDSDAVVEWVVQTTENTQTPGIQHLSTVSGNTLFLTGKSNNYLSFDDILVVNSSEFFSWIAKISLEDTQTALFPENAEQPLVYPNPTNKSLHISFPENMNAVLKLKVYCLTGEILFTSDVPKKQITIDVSSWPIGIYILETQIDTGNTYQKIIVTD